MGCKDELKVFSGNANRMLAGETRGPVTQMKVVGLSIRKAEGRTRAEVPVNIFLPRYAPDIVSPCVAIDITAG